MSIELSPEAIVNGNQQHHNKMAISIDDCREDIDICKIIHVGDEISARRNNDP